MNEEQRCDLTFAILDHMSKHGYSAEERFSKDQNMNYFVTNIDGKECLVRYIVDTDGIVSDLPCDFTPLLANSYVSSICEVARLKRRKMLRKHSL